MAWSGCDGGGGDLSGTGNRESWAERKTGKKKKKEEEGRKKGKTMGGGMNGKRKKNKRENENKKNRWACRSFYYPIWVFFISF